MRIRYAILIASLFGAGLVLGGCSSHETRPAQSSSGSTAHTSSAASSTSTRATSDQPLSGKTGIPACDDYLASYKACHRAAHIFPADTIQSHYQTMRTTLLEQSRDPRQRKILPARCRSLNKLMREALHGKSCKGPSGATDNGNSASAGSS